MELQYSTNVHKNVLWKLLTIHNSEFYLSVAEEYQQSRLLACTPSFYRVKNRVNKTHLIYLHEISKIFVGP